MDHPRYVFVHTPRKENPRKDHTFSFTVEEILHFLSAFGLLDFLLSLLRMLARLLELRSDRVIEPLLVLRFLTKPRTRHLGLAYPWKDNADLIEVSMDVLLAETLDELFQALGQSKRRGGTSEIRLSICTRSL